MRFAMKPMASELPRVATGDSADWSADRVTQLKGETTIAVIIPARNEEATVGDVVGDIAAQLGDFVDDLIVMDSLSSDRTAQIAASAGARVHSVADVRPDLGVQAGKGEALWKSLFVTDAEILVFIDADLTGWGVHFVRGVAGPLLADPDVMLCRGFYDRVLDTGHTQTVEGGRVTELTARPWLSLHRPELASMVQPLAGEWAIRRSAFEQLSVPIGYGVEIATLLDVHTQYGLTAIAQTDLGRRAHRHQHIHDLTAMSLEILAVADRRRHGLPTDPERYDAPAIDLPRMTADRLWAQQAVPIAERPPHSGVI